MVIQYLVYAGLALLPFAIVQGYDARETKDLIALVFAGAIALYGLHAGILRKIDNKFIFLVLLFMILSASQAPSSGLAVGLKHNNIFIIEGRQDIDSMWNFRPMFYALVYALMVVVIASVKIESFEPYFSIIAWAGTLSAILAVLQKFGYNQYWHVRLIGEVGFVRHAEMTGFIGQPTLLAAFVVITSGAALYLRQYWMFFMMALAVGLTESAFGVAGIISVAILWSCRYTRAQFIIGLGLICIGFFVGYHYLQPTDHGRFDVWKQIFVDLKKPVPGIGEQFAFTGYGPGAFHYAFPIMHHSPWAQAHNEYLEFLFNTGAIGFILFILSIWCFVNACFKSLFNNDIKFLLIMFVSSCIVALGTFIWQTPWGIFYTATFIGLAYNKIRSLNNVEI